MAISRTKEAGRDYYHAHKEARKASKKKYRASEKGKATAKAQAKRYREEHKEEIAAAKKCYRENNREKVNEAQRRYHREHPGKKRESHYRAKMKSPAWKLYVEWRHQPCSHCGFNDWRAIHAHHKDPQAKKFSVSNLTKLMAADLLEQELAQCEPLCANCHMILHHHQAEELPDEREEASGDDISVS